jgi:hypothetical protein
MYRINQNTNSIQKLEETTFKEIGASERNHLQEWIAKNPEVLCSEGEGLLIIQKEFDGFGDTRERLDLLALDHDGNLVIIENKLDDSGRDVTWQGLKYVSYCSSLTTDQIVGIYDAYLNKDEQNALENIREFLCIDPNEELLLNQGDQRLIMVAHKFRKEVTSTVMWLLEKDVKIQCFKAVPYKLGSESFLQLEQIIPLPETKEYVIKLQAKEKQIRSQAIPTTAREKNVVGFWNEFKKQFSEQGFHKFDTVTPSHRRYYLGFGMGAGSFVCCFGNDGLRVEFVLMKDDNNAILTKLENYKESIEFQFGKLLIWEKPLDKRFSKVQHTFLYSDLKKGFKKAQSREMGHWRDGEDWQPRIDWFLENFSHFYEVVEPYWSKVRFELK